MTSTDHARGDYGTVLPAALSAIPGLDTASGLAAVRDNVPRYLELLQRFAADHAEDMQRLGTLLATGDRTGATRLAHSIKGTAATLGAMQLSENARRLEMKLRGDTALADLQAEMRTVEQDLLQLNAALPALSVMPATTPAATDTPPADPARLKAILDTLETQLAEGDLAASALFHEHAALLGTALGPDCRKIAEAIRQYDFSAALEVLRSLRAKVASP